MTETKQELRIRSKKQLMTLSHQEIARDSELVSWRLIEFLLSFEQFKHFFSIGAYNPLRGEVIWYKALDDLTHFKICYPEINSSDVMEYFPITAKTLHDSKYREKSNFEFEESKKAIVPDILLVPGLMFDKNGYRLGRGGGYFDRFLKNFKGISIGLCFSKQVVENLPVEPHDISCHYVVTEKNIFQKFEE